MKLFRFSFHQKLIPITLLIGLILISPSLSGGESRARIRVTAVVLPKTPPLNYERLHEKIMKRVEDYPRQARSENQKRFFKATVNLDFQEGSHGIVIEEIE